MAAARNISQKRRKSLCWSNAIRRRSPRRAQSQGTIRHTGGFAPCDTVETLALLVEAAKEAWHSIDEEVLNSLAIRMPNRFKAIQEAKGWYTKY